MSIKLIIALGNVGIEYTNTRHNAGVWFLEKLAEKYELGFNYEKKFNSKLSKLNLKENLVYLLIPQTYMNIIGDEAIKFINFYKIEAKDILVVYDELDLPTGVSQFKFGGGSAGHNGIKSIDKIMPELYWKLRIGIGHPSDKYNVSNYVLSKPNDEDLILINNSIKKAIDVLPIFISGNTNEALKLLHTK